MPPKTLELRIEAALKANDPANLGLRRDLLEMCRTMRSCAGASICEGFEFQVESCYEADEFRKTVMGRAPNARQHDRLYPQSPD